MNNKCQDCGKCCLETEMPLSERDIELIIANSLNNLNEDDFAIKKNEDYYQLKNINGHCFFLDNQSKICKIYANRPQGCRFYPIIYDFDKNQCVFDEECPRTDLFQLMEIDFKQHCNRIKQFLREELKISLKIN